MFTLPPPASRLVAAAPLYLQIAEGLLDRIESGELAPGDRLPPERALSEMLGVNRLTLRRALQTLETQGLLTRRQGKGTYVASPKIERQASQLVSFTHGMRRSGFTPGIRLIAAEERPVEAALAGELHLPTSAPVYDILRIRTLNQEPMLLERYTFSVRRFPGLLRFDLQTRSLYEILETEYRVVIQRARQSLEPVVASEYEAGLLGIKPGAPLMLERRLSFDAQGAPVEHGRDLYRGDRFRFTTETAPWDPSLGATWAGPQVRAGKEWKAMIAESAKLLTPEQVRRVHEASLEILERVGLLVRNEKARQIFASHGAKVDTETQIVRLPRAVVEEFRASIPPKFTFRGRDPELDRTIPDDSPVIVTGSSAPNIVDPVTGAERRARSDDLARIAWLINALPGYDVFSISTLADDAPPGLFSATRFYVALKYCRKPVRGSGPPDDTQKILRLAYLVAGGEAAYRDHPFITHHYCPVVSPLTMDFDSTQNLIDFTEMRLPCYATIVPNAGLTAPLTLLGTLAQGNSEFLAEAVLEQMIDPGKATIYASLPTVADTRSGAYAPGAIETGILMMGVGQMARFYNVPSGGYIGLTNSKVNDAQSGYETGMSTLAGLLGDVDMFNMGGLLDALMSFDFAKAVIDNEISLMLKKVMRGLEFSEDNLALDLIAQVGPTGMFMDQQHTVDRMRTTGLLPDVADRDPRGLWLEKGSSDSHARARRLAREILTREGQATFSPEVDARIRAEFTAMVPGELVPPEGWTRQAGSGGAARAERRRRREGAGQPA